MDLRQLVRAFDAGRIDADTLVWRKGMPDWRRLRDISELAERLIGADDTGSSAAVKGGSSTSRPATGRPAANGASPSGASPSAGEPAPAELGQSRSEPPPRQSERSRTPPASYTVGSRSGSEPPASLEARASRQSSIPPPGETGERPSLGASAETGMANGSNRSSSAASQSSPPLQSSAAELSARSGAGREPSSKPPSAPRPHSRRGRGKTPSRPNGSPVALTRTVTQTGLESPADAAARNSVAPAAPSGGNGSGDAADGGRSSNTSTSSSSATRLRGSAPPGGARRQPSSDETPAQKPSSLSVPPGALLSSTARPRGRRLLALAAVVLGGLILVRQFAADTERAGTTAHRVDAVSDPKQVESALAPKAAGAPSVAGSSLSEAAPLRSAPAVPAAVTSTAREPHGVSAPGASAPADSAPSALPSVAAAPAPTAAPEAPPPARLTGAAPMNVEASTKESLGVVGMAAVRPAPSASVNGSSPSVPASPPVRATSTPQAAAAPRPLAPAAARPATAPAPASVPPVPPAPRAPRPFDESLATQQFEAAAAKASDCAQAGPTRGAGRVKVAIEPWGRVGRVTHLNQDFVGTPVGLCVMQAFQQIQLPPFDGNSRAIAGEFVIR
jgi:hypothetical protein